MNQTPTPPGNPSPMEAEDAEIQAAAKVVSQLYKQFGRAPDRQWCYLDEHGKPVQFVLRWNTPNGKEIRPIAKFPQGWRIGALPEPRPLYRLPEILARPNEIIFVAEGEPAADVLCELGLLGTTVSGGANAARLADWSVVEGRIVCLVPDNDNPGRRFVKEAAEECWKRGAASVRLLDLSRYAPRMKKGDDIVDVYHDKDLLGLSLGEASTLGEWLLGVAKKLPDWRPGVVTPRIRCSTEVIRRPIEWLWPGRIPLGHVTILAGRPGCGKSLLVCDIAARVSRGAEWPEDGWEDAGNAPLGDVLMMCAEDTPEDIICPRLDATGAYGPRVHFLEGGTLITEEWSEASVHVDLTKIDVIREAIAKLPTCKLLTIDPLGSFVGPRTDTYVDNQVRYVLSPLMSLAAELGIAVLIVCHTRKLSAPTLRADDLVMGSRGFVGVARSVLHVLDHPDVAGRQLLLPGKNNVGNPPGLAFDIVGEPPRVDWVDDPAADSRVDDVIAKRNNPRGPQAVTRDRVAEWLADLLSDGPVPVTRIRQEANDAGWSWSTVRRAQEKLGVTPWKSSYDGGWVWELPNGESALPVR